MLRYRLWQFWQIITAVPLAPEVQEEVAAILSENELRLFEQLSINDQWHSYRVLKMLQAAGHQQRPLQVAALLHDVGKTRLHLSVWERSLIIVAAKLLPGQTAVWGKGEAVGWKRPFVVKAQHPAWSAELAIAAGTDQLAVSLIRRHQEAIRPEENGREAELLRLLQWADDQN